MPLRDIKLSLSSRVRLIKSACTRLPMSQTPRKLVAFTLLIKHIKPLFLSLNDARLIHGSVTRVQDETEKNLGKSGCH